MPVLKLEKDAALVSKDINFLNIYFCNNVIDICYTQLLFCFIESNERYLGDRLPL